MEMWYLVFILVASSSISSTLASANGQCCPQGQAVLRSKNTRHYCWEPHSNVTSFIPLTCNLTSFRYRSNYSSHFVTEAGQLKLKVQNIEMDFAPGSFCVGNVTIRSDINFTKIKDTAIVCYDQPVKIVGEEIYGYCMIFSAIFLFITAFIYAALPGLRDLQGKSIINFCGSLATGLVVLAVMKLVAYSDMNLCAARGFFAYFFILASFFWTNAISIQILLGMRRPTVCNYGWKEFVWYAIYAWGCPVLLTVAMAIVNFLPGDHEKPGIGLNHCWFYNTTLQWQYMYSVMTILIVINICIFIYTSVLLWRHSFSSSSHLKALRYKFLMTIRLFIVMGVAWIFEMIGSLVSSHIAWEILDLVNSLQGVFIFLVLVVFRRRAIKMMHKHGWLDCVSGPVERYLAVGEDQEEVVQHTIGLSMEEPNGRI